MENQTIDLSFEQAYDLYYPKKVLVVYQKDTKNNSYIEISDLYKNQPTGFRPLMLSELKNIVSNIDAVENGAIACKGIFPSNILFTDILNGNFRIIWYKKAEIKQLKFEVKGISNVTIKVPPMIYDVTRNSIKVHCFTGSKPTLNTKIYKAPYMNLSIDGKVCTGNVDIKIPFHTDYNEIMQLWERYFWDSYFTSSGDDCTLQLWEKLSKEKAKEFPLNKLQINPKYKSFKDIIYGK